MYIVHILYCCNLFWFKFIPSKISDDNFFAPLNDNDYGLGSLSSVHDLISNKSSYHVYTSIGELKHDIILYDIMDLLNIITQDLIFVC